jgi:CheY-like chemotaxis protein
MADVRERGTVLVVEDNDDVLEMLQDGLALHGYRVLGAHDGLKALTILASTPVDVIVLDLSMPVMSGWEFLEARSGDPAVASIPVVVMSALPVLEGPWNAYVRKPFEIADLVNAIERCRQSSPRVDPSSELRRG